MSNNNNEADWWKKPDHLDPKKSKSKKSKSRKRSRAPKGREISRLGLARRLTIHLLLLLGLGLLLAVSAHFIFRLTTRHGVESIVPNFELLSLEDAERLASNSGLNLILNDSLYAPTFERGVVIDQTPEEGTVVKPGRSIYVTINATQQQMVDVPYVAGRSLRQAKSMLEVAGLSIKRLIYESDLATNYVLSQSYNSEEIEEESQMRVPVGSGIVLHVGLGDGRGETLIPELMGRSLHSAKSAILDAGLNIGHIKMESGTDSSNERYALVLTQSIPADSVVRLGSELSFAMTLYPEKVDSLARAIEKAQRLQEMMELEEQALTDSLEMLIPIDSLILEERVETPKVERVDFEDLF